MQIKFTKQHITLRPEQEETIQKKVEHLTHLASRLDDASSSVHVDLIHEEHRSPEDRFICHLTFFVPNDTLRSEAMGESIENAVDEAINKMKGQIDYYKTKTHHLDERPT